MDQALTSAKNNPTAFLNALKQALLLQQQTTTATTTPRRVVGGLGDSGVNEVECVGKPLHLTQQCQSNDNDSPRCNHYPMDYNRNSIAGSFFR